MWLLWLWSFGFQCFGQPIHTHTHQFTSAHISTVHHMPSSFIDRFTFVCLIWHVCHSAFLFRSSGHGQVLYMKGRFGICLVYFLIGVYMCWWCVCALQVSNRSVGKYAQQSTSAHISTHQQMSNTFAERFAFVCFILQPCHGAVIEHLRAGQWVSMNDWLLIVFV